MRTGWRTLESVVGCMSKAVSVFDCGSCGSGGDVNGDRDKIGMR